MLLSKLKSLAIFAAICLPTTFVSPSAQAATCSGASFYGGHGDGYAWQTMANGQPMNPNAMITAHRSLPFGTKLRVTNQSNGKSVVVTVTDRGPFVSGRELDLSYAAFTALAPASRGHINVCYTVA